MTDLCKFNYGPFIFGTPKFSLALQKLANACNDNFELPPPRGFKEIPVPPYLSSGPPPP